jgi:hypothetical protein
MPNSTPERKAEQEAYAAWLAWGVRVGFAVLVGTFFLYVTGLVPAGVAPERLPELWALPVNAYLAATGAPTGWSWIHRLGEGDLLNLVGVAILAATSIACHLRVLPLFLRSGERAFAAICVAQVIVLGAAAAGIF